MKPTNYLPRYENSHALVISIDEYQNVPPLANACADATSVAEALGGELGFPQDNVTVLLNSDATGEKIRERFLTFGSLGANDRVVFFFAGHGATVDGHHGPIGYLIPADGKLDDKSTLIRWTQLTQDADLIPAKHILFIMDACYSGLAMQRAARSAGSRFISDMLQRHSRQVITAGKGNEPVSDGGGPTGGNSLFTAHLLEGMRGKAANADGVLTASYLMSYVYHKVANDPYSHQTPSFGHIDGDGDLILRTPPIGQPPGAKPQDFVVAQVPERPEAPPVEALGTTVKPVFAERNGYGNPDSETFGINDWTTKLGMMVRSDGQAEFHSASHWLSIVVEPASAEPLALDIATLNRTLRGHAPAEAKPHDQIRLPSQSITTSTSLILYDNFPNPSDSGVPLWNRFLRIEGNGAMEYCATKGVSGVYRPDAVGSQQQRSFRLFSYVPAIGLICNVVFAMKRILDTAGYTAGVRVIVNFTGTRDSILRGFAQGAKPGGQPWLEPFATEARFSNSIGKWCCHEANLQFEYKLVLASFGQAEMASLIEDCARKLGLAYNHQSEPRCYIHGTHEFPWLQFDPHEVQ